ncbi:MAG: Asp23/Gls24 family envelope stress response protein [Actinomycetota bacterium]|nr:Asp23/Gls24 family envelope stress response protein [Actinomycetota bacterium]
MADTTSTSTQSSGSSGAPARTGGTAPTRLAEDTSQGKTTIAASVVQKVAGMAAREISGVYALGGGLSRAFGEIRERIPGSTGASQTSGVSVEVGEKQAAIDIDLIVEYGASIVELAKAVRRNVVGAVEQMIGLEVIEVNIAVNDIHIASDDGGEVATQPARVE